MLPGSLAIATSIGKVLAIVFDNNLQTGILITLGVLLLLVGTLLRHKFPANEVNSEAPAHSVWPKPANSTGYIGNAAGAGESSSFSFSRSLDHENPRRPIGHLAIQSAPTTQRRANLV